MRLRHLHWWKCVYRGYSLDAFTCRRCGAQKETTPGTALWYSSSIAQGLGLKEPPR